jgi:hypothetical protein
MFPQPFLSLAMRSTNRKSTSINRHKGSQLTSLLSAGIDEHEIRRKIRNQIKVEFVL